MALDMALFRLGINAGDSVPIAIAISDFKNGVYSLGGTIKTFGDLWVADPVNWFPWDSSYLIAGTGIVFNAIHFIGLLVSSALLAVVPANFTCIFEYSKIEPDGHFAFSVGNDLSFSYESQWDDDHNPSYGAALLSFSPNTDALFQFAPETIGFHKYAVTFSAELLAVSIDGSAPLVTGTRSALDAGVMGFLMGAGYPDSNTGGVTLEKITFFNALSPANLRVMSS